MNVGHACEIPRDSGYLNACAICGAPTDSNYFDVASFKPAPADVGQEVELARHALHSQYCGALLYFAQYAERAGSRSKVIGNARLRMDDPLQQPAAGAVPADQPDPESVGSCVPGASEAGGGMHDADPGQAVSPPPTVLARAGASWVATGTTHYGGMPNRL